jgi:hypothetical protein
VTVATAEANERGALVGQCPSFLFVWYTVSQCPQVAQWPPPHEPHPPPPWLPATGRLLPPLSLLTAEKTEIMRRAPAAAQWGQATALPD